MKYFLLGAFSSAFFLYGTALLYGYAGTVALAGISPAHSDGRRPDPLLLLGTALLGVGLLFKIGAAPFQAWKPDVYQGAPTPDHRADGLRHAGRGRWRAAAGLLGRLWATLDWNWRPVMWGVAILTMIVGAILAITQTDIKRMLAYSSIAHAGFLLIGVVATASTAGQRRSLRRSCSTCWPTASPPSARSRWSRWSATPAARPTHLSRWAGLGKRSPVLAGVFAFFLLAFAGIPLTSGFFGKYAVFAAAGRGGGDSPLVIVAW